MFAPELLNDDGREIGTVTVVPKGSLSGMVRILGRGMDMNGGSRVWTLNSLGNLISGPVKVLPLFGLLPAMRKLPCGVNVMLE